jgi:hypothetical protein
MLVELAAQRRQPLIVSGFQSQGDRGGFRIQSDSTTYRNVSAPVGGAGSCVAVVGEEQLAAQ